MSKEVLETELRLIISYYLIAIYQVLALTENLFYVSCTPMLNEKLVLKSIQGKIRRSNVRGNSSHREIGI